MVRSAESQTTILIVDDHVMFRQGLASLLNNQPDFKVISEAGSGEEAVPLVAQLKPDLVLLDISLPDGNGLDFIQALLSESPHSIVVVLTVHESDDLLLVALARGAKGYVYKSMPISGLLASLRGLRRGEPGITRSMTRRILDEFHRLAKMVTSESPTESVSLSARELEVLKLLANDSSNREIAQRLFITEHTVKVHVHNILTKLNLPNRKEAGRFVNRFGISDADEYQTPK